MATLSGNKIKNTYQSLVKFSDNELLLVAEEVADEDNINTEFISKKIEAYNELMSNASDSEKNKIMSKIDSLKSLLN